MNSRVFRDDVLNIQNTNQNQKFVENDRAISLFNDSKSNQNSKQMNLDNDFPHWNTIIEKINTIWKKNYLNQIKILNSQSEIDSHVNKFESEMQKMFAKRSEYVKWQKYFVHVINYQLNRIKKSLNDSSISINDENNGTICTTNDSKVDQKIDNLIINDLKTIKKFISYNLAYVIRCHSKDGMINDDKTSVFEAAFQPDPIEYGKFTNICATCGGSVINFIDVSTGNVVKRFNDSYLINKKKEFYYRCLWSIINETSVLVAAGLHGDIKIIIPDKSKCVLRISAHDKQIHSLLFHNRYSNILFSASEERKIQMWRLLVNDDHYGYDLIGHIKYKSDDHKHAHTHEAVLTMCICKNYLILSTTLDHYYVELDDYQLLNTTSNQFEEKNKYVLNAKRLLIEFDDQIPKIEEFITNKLICIEDKYIVANFYFSYSIFIFEMIETINDETNKIKLKYHSWIDLPVKCDFIDASISVFKDEDVYYILKATEHGVFYKIELNKDLTHKRKSLIKFKIPIDYVVKTKNTNQSINVKNFDLLDKPKVYTCVSNCDYICATTNNNLITVWSKELVDNSQC